MKQAAMKTKVSERGQVTIPKPLRDRLGIRPGQELEMREDEGRIIVTKVTEIDPVEAVTGILDVEESVDALVEELRGTPDAT